MEKELEEKQRLTFERYQDGAKKGDAEATNNLALCYFWGHGVERDLLLAAHYHQKAAEMGLADGMYETGYCYRYGLGVTQDLEKAVEWLTKAVEQGVVNAMIELGSLYYNGIGRKRDWQKAFEYYRQGAEHGSSLGKLLLAEFYEKGLAGDTNREKARELYQEAYDDFLELASRGDVDAQRRMGDWFFTGIPLLDKKRDFIQAARWFQKAAENDSPEAQSNLGLCYYFGLGVVQNYETAAYWYGKAAEKQLAVALDNLGGCYYEGRGVEQDYKRAAELIGQAANQDYPNSQSSLGVMYLKGMGVEKNYILAVKWLQKACGHKVPDAFAHLGLCYMEGLGVVQDESKAVELFKQGHDLDDKKATVALARCYMEGKGVNADFHEAATLLEHVCRSEKETRESLSQFEQFNDNIQNTYLKNPLDEVYNEDYATACYLLATMYHAGRGVKHDANEAIRLLQLADKYGYKDEKGGTAESLMEQIMAETPVDEIRHTVKSTIEVKELYRGVLRSRRMRYAIILHHADGKSEELKFNTKRQWLVYVLALMFASCHDRNRALMTRYFPYAHQELCELAAHIGICVKSGIDAWIDEFTYREAEGYRKNGRGYFEYNNGRYSDAVSGVKKLLRKHCVNDDEYETFRLHTSGGRRSVAFVAAPPQQIILPDSLDNFVKSLPTIEELLGYEPKDKWISVDDDDD